MAVCGAFWQIVNNNIKIFIMTDRSLRPPKQVDYRKRHKGGMDSAISTNGDSIHQAQAILQQKIDDLKKSI